MVRITMPIFVICLLFFILSGCTDNPVYEDIYLTEAPGIRITAEALKELESGSIAHTLSYTTCFT